MNRQLALCVWIVLACPCFAVADDAPAANESATREALDELLIKLWDSPSDKVLTRGNAVRTRARKNGADMVLVEHAYAVLMLHHKQWDVAKGVLRKRYAESPNDGDAWLCAVYESIHSERGDLALKTLDAALDALEAQDGFEDVAMTVAGLASFHKSIPLPKVREREIRALEEKARGRLSPQQQLKFDAKKLAIVGYISGLGAERARRMQALDETRGEIRQTTLRLNQMQDQWQSYKDAYDRHAESIAAINTQIAVTQDQFQQLINTTDDPRQRARLQNQMQIAVSQFQVQHRTHTQAAADLDRRARALTAQMRPVEQRLQQLTQQLQQEEERINRELAIPPLDVHPDQQREKLLKASDFDVSGVTATKTMGRPTSPSSASPPPPPLPPAPPTPAAAAPSAPMKTPAKTESDSAGGASDERKAEGMLRNAEVLYKADRKEAAIEKLQSLIDRYPKTKAAEKAKKVLKEAKEGGADE